MPGIDVRRGKGGKSALRAPGLHFLAFKATKGKKKWKGALGSTPVRADTPDHCSQGWEKGRELSESFRSGPLFLGGAARKKKKKRGGDEGRGPGYDS